jgi:cytoskeletal protein CcmA (bactofilin family)
MASKSEPLNSIIGEGSIFQGKFYIAGSLRVDGKFEGEIVTDEDMVIGEKGRVKTNIRAKRVQVTGTVVGNIEAGEEVRLEKIGKVLGNMSTPNLHMEEGVMAMGEIEVRGDNDPDMDLRRDIEATYEEGGFIPEGVD